MIGPGRLVVTGEGSRPGSSIEDALTELLSRDDLGTADGGLAVAVLDREHGGDVLAIGFSPPVDERGGALLSEVIKLMARHFSRVDTPNGLPGMDD